MYVAEVLLSSSSQLTNKVYDFNFKLNVEIDEGWLKNC